MTTSQEAHQNKLVEELSTYIPNAKTKYKDHYATLLNWARRKNIEVVVKPKEVEVVTLTPEQIEYNKERMAAIRSSLASKLNMKA